MRNTPHIEFVGDDSIERGTRILEIMDSLGLTDDETPTSDDDGPDSPDGGTE
jgi:hypothetical protein